MTSGGNSLRQETHPVSQRSKKRMRKQHEKQGEQSIESSAITMSNGYPNETFNE
jgi:hypothetical protein